MNAVLEQIKLIGLVPVIKLNDPEKAVPLAKALAAGGIPAAEITFRAPGAEKAIAAIAKEVPEVFVGAGTVTTKKQVDLAAAAGAMYIISPGFDPEIVEYCLNKNLLIIPGCANAGDVSMASRMGLEAVKFFPAEAAGGLKMLKALCGPFPAMRFIPTGGINPDNILEYITFPRVIACGGSWMVPENLIDDNDFTGITELARQAVFKMLDIKLDHIGMNSTGDGEAENTAGLFSKITGNPITEIPVSFFSGAAVEVMKKSDRGVNGHIAFSVTDISRAVRFFESQGFAFDPESRKTDSHGATRFIYFRDEMGGFAVHLTLK